MSHKKMKKLLLLALYEVLLVPIALKLELNVIGYIIASWTIPSIFIFYRLPTFRLRYIFEGLLWSVPASIIIDYIGHYTNTWSYWNNANFVPTGIQIGPLPLESYIWAFSFWIFTIAIYEYFLDTHRTHNFKIGDKIFSFILAIAALFSVYYLESNSPTITYFYSWLLAFTLLLNVFVFVFRKKLIKRLLLLGAISLFLGIVVKLTSLGLNLWEFSATESLYIFDLGKNLLPLEEILWWLLLPIAIAGTHEIFSDTGD